MYQMNMDHYYMVLILYRKVFLNDTKKIQKIFIELFSILFYPYVLVDMYNYNYNSLYSHQFDMKSSPMQRMDYSNMDRLVCYNHYLDNIPYIDNYNH